MVSFASKNNKKNAPLIFFRRCGNRRSPLGIQWRAVSRQIVVRLPRPCWNFRNLWGHLYWKPKIKSIGPWRHVPKFPLHHVCTVLLFQSGRSKKTVFTKLTSLPRMGKEIFSNVHHFREMWVNCYFCLDSWWGVASVGWGIRTHIRNAFARNYIITNSDHG